MNRICVFCGSSPGSGSEFVDAARHLGRAIVGNGMGVVYGGAQVGVMGALADAALDAGGEVVGVIPEALVGREVAHGGLTELRVVQSMHERKAEMAALADAFIAMPGGLGTLEEIFEVLTWAQLGIHSKPCGMLNVAGYFDGLLGFLDNAVRRRFVRPQHRDMILVAVAPEELLAALAAYEPREVTKWLDASRT